VKSAAHGEWQGARSRRLDRLLDAHKAAEGAGAPGRRWRTEQINWSLALLLAAEFQGYARDLHNEAGNSFAILAAQGNPTLETILKTRMTQNRQLDRGNANPGNLGTDFKILGLDLWGDLKTQWPGLAPKWSVNLAELNQAPQRHRSFAEQHDRVDERQLAYYLEVAQVTGRFGRQDGRCSSEPLEGPVQDWRPVAAGRRHTVNTRPKLGDVVAVRQGRYVVRARVIESYRSPTGPRVTVRVPADPAPDDDTSTFSYSVDDLEAVAA
jgi:hypothetical protein